MRVRWRGRSESSSQTGEMVVCRDTLWTHKGAGRDEKNKTNKNSFIFRRQLRSPSSSCASAVGVARVQVRSLAACTFDQRFVIGPSRFFFVCPTSTWHCSHANRSSFAFFIPPLFLSFSPFAFIPGLFFSPFFLSVSRWQLCRDVDTHTAYRANHQPSGFVSTHFCLLFLPFVNSGCFPPKTSRLFDVGPLRLQQMCHVLHVHAP